MSTEPTDEDLARMLERYGSQLQAKNLGELDDAKLYAALTAVLEVHDEAGMPIRDLLDRTEMTLAIRVSPDDPTRLEVHVANSKRMGTSVCLATLPVAELLRGGEG